MGKALESYNWGFRISGYSEGLIHIIMDEIEDESFQNLAKENLQLQNKVTELNETISKITKEYLQVKEKLDKYEQIKK